MISSGCKLSGCSFNDYACLEVRHGIRFLDFGQSNWIFSLLVKGDMLGFVLSLGNFNFGKIGLGVVPEGGFLWQVIS